MDLQKDALESIKFDCVRNAIYHSSRSNWFEGWGRFLNFIIIICGASVVGPMFPSGSAAVSAWAGLITAIAGTFQLVFDISNRARRHEFLQKKYFDVLAEIEAENNCSEDTIRKYKSQLTKIYADEPPVMRGLDAVSYNAASDALGKEWGVKFGWWHSLLRHLYPFNGTDFQPYAKDRKSIQGNVAPAE